MKKHIRYCNPKQGRFNWEKSLNDLPEKLSKYGRVKVTFEKYIPMKSLDQLGYYHAGILPFLEKTLFNETGMVKDEWHEALKEKLGLKKMSKCGTFQITVSHKDYTEKDMSEYINRVIGFAKDFFGTVVPPPTNMEEYL